MGVAYALASQLWPARPRRANYQQTSQLLREIDGLNASRRRYDHPPPSAWRFYRAHMCVSMCVCVRAGAHPIVIGGCEEVTISALGSSSLHGLTV